MQIIHLFPGSFASNCYLLEDRTSGKALIVDPGASAASILRRLQEDGCTPQAILLTHGHFDHIMSVDTLRAAVPGLKLCIHRADAPMMRDSNKNAFAFFFSQDRTWNEADELLEDGQILTVGETEIRVIHTPGHSPGSVCYLIVSEHALITGDTLFADNIGRCDLWGGDHTAIMQSLKHLRTLDGTLTIYPGHGNTNNLSKALDNAYLL